MALTAVPNRMRVLAELRTFTQLQKPVFLAPGLYGVYTEYEHRDAANVYAIIGNGPVVLIDCGSVNSLPLMLTNLRQLGIRPEDITCVIATHPHYDHISAFPWLRRLNPTIELWMHAADIGPVVQGNNVTTASWLYRRDSPEIKAGWCNPILPGQTIKVAGVRLTADLLPGHTPHHLGFWGTFGHHRIVFAGDSVNGFDFDEHRADDQWRQTFDRLEGDSWWRELLLGHEDFQLGPVGRSQFKHLRYIFEDVIERAPIASAA